LNLGTKEEVDELYRRWQQTAQRLSQSSRISRGVCVSSESPTWTTTNCVCSTTFRRGHWGAS